jgi:hypothetical protein
MSAAEKADRARCDRAIRSAALAPAAARFELISAGCVHVGDAKTDPEIMQAIAWRYRAFPPVDVPLGEAPEHITFAHSAGSDGGAWRGPGLLVTTDEIYALDPDVMHIEPGGATFSPGAKRIVDVKELQPGVQLLVADAHTSAASVLVAARRIGDARLSVAGSPYGHAHAISLHASASWDEDVKWPHVHIRDDGYKVEAIGPKDRTGIPGRDPAALLEELAALRTDALIVDVSGAPTVADLAIVLDTAAKAGFTKVIVPALVGLPPDGVAEYAAAGCIPADVAAEGALDRAVIRAKVVAKKDLFTACWTEAGPRHPGGVKVTMRFTIDGNGRVIASYATGANDPTLEACVATAVRQVPFPKPQGAGIVNVLSYPMIFH